MRRKWVTFHVWLGLTLGLLWALQGLGGALLVFHRDLQRIAGPAGLTGPMISLDHIAARAGRDAAAPIERIGITDERGDLLVAEYRDGRGLPRAKLIDAARGDVVGDRELEPVSPLGSNFWGWLYRFHESLGGGDSRAPVVGLSGVTLLSALVAGLWVGWPRRKAWRAAFSAGRWRSRDQQLYGWHRAMGLVAGMALIATVPCGVYLIFAADLRPLIARVVPHSLPYRAIPADLPAKSDRVSPDGAYREALRLFPSAAFVSVTLPTARAPVYVVRLRQPEEWRSWSGTTSVTIDASGRVLAQYDAIRAPLSNRITDAIFAIHSGEISGPAGRFLVMLLGLALPTFYVTGVWAWLRRKKRRRVRKEPAAAPTRVATE